MRRCRLLVALGVAALLMLVPTALDAGHPGCCTWSGTRSCLGGTALCCRKCGDRCLFKKP